MVKVGQFTFNRCLDIEGLYHVEPNNFLDIRGYNFEAYNIRDFHKAGLDMDFVQINQSMSVKGVLRGLHFQKTHQQGKLVRVIKGEVFDVAVDIRANSKSYGKWYSIILSAAKNNMLYIPEGFAHGFFVLSDTAEFIYHLTDYYYPEDESGIIWNDKTLGIKWPITDVKEVILSEKDMRLPLFTDIIPLEPKIISPR